MCVYVCVCVHDSRQQLGVVMLLPGFQFLSPLQERPEGGVWLLCDDALIPVGPNLQTDQRHADVQSPVELNTHTYTEIFTHTHMQSCKLLLLRDAEG